MRSPGRFPAVNHFRHHRASSASLSLGSDAIQRGAYIEQSATWDGRLTLTGALRGEGPHGLLGKGTLGFPRIAASWIPWQDGSDVVRVHAAYGVSGDLPVTQRHWCKRSAAISSVRHGRVDLPGPAGWSTCTRVKRGSMPRADAFSASATVYQRTIDDMTVPFPLDNFDGIERSVPEHHVHGNHGIDLTLVVAASEGRRSVGMSV